MKKILLAVAGLLLSTGAFAQMQWGIKAGGVLANRSNASEYIEDWVALNGENALLKSKNKPSFHAGLFFEIKLKGKFAVQPEVLYVRQGNYMHEKQVRDWATIKVWRKLNYINVPVMFKYNFWDNFTLDFGPQVGYMIDYVAILGGGPGETLREEYRDDSNLKKLDVAACLGVSYRVHRSVDFSFRYNYGFLRTDKATETEDRKMRNRVMQLSVGLWL